MSLQRCGLMIDPACCWLAASPYRTVDKDGLVEMNCLFAIKDEKVEAMLLRGSRSYLQLVDGKLSSDYYFQVIG